MLTDTVPRRERYQETAGATSQSRSRPAVPEPPTCCVPGIRRLGALASLAPGLELLPSVPQLRRLPWEHLSEILCLSPSPFSYGFTLYSWCFVASVGF